MHVQSKIHTAFSHGGKANTHEPSLALRNLSAIMPQWDTSLCLEDLNCQALIKPKKAVTL